ncbi:hypothetical protein KIN20_000916 [Parelaphostrongylus tenuis]|uniref:Uncharacterized protein n=1 Tax=Parelaphostrongylus tenuis TaxID=148309 RepID=A0AAD5LVE8_PARTN|nr:hypothetical protein KIN20_000916 [Parelaphostrongylus tenuis]
MSAFVFVEVCGYICGAVSAVANGVFLSIIHRNASRHLSQYKLSLTLIAFSDIAVSTFFLLCQPCILVDGQIILAVLLGPSTFIHHVLASLCFVVFIFIFVLCTLQVATPFLFRVFAHKENKTSCQVSYILITAAIVGLIIVAPLVFLCFQTANNNTKKFDHFQRVVKEFSKHEETPQFVTYELDAVGKVWLIFLALACSVGCLTVAMSSVLSSGVISCAKLLKYSSARSGEIANSIIVTAFSTTVLVIVPLTLFAVFAVFDKPMFGYSIPLFLGAAFFPIFNPFLIIFNVRNFRKNFLTIVSKPKNIGPISYLSSEH